MGALLDLALKVKFERAVPQDLERLVRSVCVAYSCTAQEIEEALVCASRDQDGARQSYTAMYKELALAPVSRSTS